jgi:hypothetical protein
MACRLGQVAFKLIHLAPRLGPRACHVTPMLCLNINHVVLFPNLFWKFLDVIENYYYYYFFFYSHNAKKFFKKPLVNILQIKLWLDHPKKHWNVCGIFIKTFVGLQLFYPFFLILCVFSLNLHFKNTKNI